MSNQAASGAILFDSPSAQLVFFDHRLKSIHNLLLPAEYRDAAMLQFLGEDLQLAVDGKEVALVPQPRTQHLAQARVRGGHVRLSAAPMMWAPGRGVEFSRSVELLPGEPSRVQAVMRLRLRSVTAGVKCALLKWRLQLPACQALTVDGNGQIHRLASGPVPLALSQAGRLLFSLDSRRLYRPGNRVLEISFSGLGPHALALTPQADGSLLLEAHFSAELQSEAMRDAGVRLDYQVLLPRQMSSTVFLVARPSQDRVLWQGAVAAVTTWVDPIERYPGFRRLAPVLWFDREQPLSSAVLRFLHSMAILRRIIVIGEVLPHDLENLLTALLDRGDDRRLRLQLFTTDEYFRDRVNVLRGNIQARMLMTNESPERVERMETLVCTKMVSDPDLLPLYVHRFFSESAADEPIEPCERVRSALLVPAAAGDASHIAAACAPLARQLGAPVFLFDAKTEAETIAELQRSQVGLVLSLGCARDEQSAKLLQERLRAQTHSNLDVVDVPCGEAGYAATALARLFKVKWLIDFLLAASDGARDEASDAPPSLAAAVRDYVASVAALPWAQQLKDAIDRTPDQPPPRKLYLDLFIGCDEFISSCKSFFAARSCDPKLREPLVPLWNDMVVLCDYVALDRKRAARSWNQSNESLNLFLAASFATYHDAPLLLFPTVLPAPQEEPSELLERSEHERGILSPELLMTLHALRPLTLGIYSANPHVQFEMLRDQTGMPLGLRFVVSRLCGADPFDTSLVTLSGSVHAEALRRERKLRVLLWGANIASLKGLELYREIAQIAAQLKTPEESTDSGYEVDLIDDKDTSKSGPPNRSMMLTRLREPFHIFHFAGHATANAAQPMLSGIFVGSDRDPTEASVLTALQVRYRVKLGASPIVFINACDSAFNGRLPIEAERTPDTPVLAEPTVSRAESARVIGISSSFIHNGAAAVIAPMGRILDPAAVQFATSFYTYLRQGCSIGEAALLARSDLWKSPPVSSTMGSQGLQYVIYGDPTLRLRSLSVILHEHAELACRLLRWPSSAQDVR